MTKLFTAIFIAIISGVLIYVGERMISTQEELKIEIAVLKVQMTQLQTSQQEIKNYFGIPKYSTSKNQKLK